MTGIKESDTGLAAPALWDLAADKQTLTNEQPLQVIRSLLFCLKCVIFGFETFFTMNMILSSKEFKLYASVLGSNQWHDYVVSFIGGSLHKNHQRRFR